jgi:hypothetical protein
MIMEGKFDGFYQFLLELEQLPRITRIHQMKMMRGDDLGGPGSLESDGSMKVEFAVSIYFEPQNFKID